MTGSVAHIWRHPIKALGREEVPAVDLAARAWLPYDRLWAVAHDRAKPSDGWMHKVNFLRGVTEPRLMAVTARLDEDTGQVRLDHPEAGEIEVSPDDPADWPVFAAWLARIWPAELPGPIGVVRNTGVQMTDVPEPWLSLNNLSSHRAVEGRVGRPLSVHRWRGNIWLDGLGPWEEFEWIGRRVRLGSVLFEVRERITRCKATMANPDTGRRDADTLGALQSWNHQDFGVYAAVLSGGRLKRGDTVEVIQ